MKFKLKNTNNSDIIIMVAIKTIISDYDIYSKNPTC